MQGSKPKCPNKETINEMINDRTQWNRMINDRKRGWKRNKMCFYFKTAAYWSKFKKKKYERGSWSISWTDKCFFSEAGRKKELRVDEAMTDPAGQADLSCLYRRSTSWHVQMDCGLKVLCEGVAFLAWTISQHQLFLFKNKHPEESQEDENKALLQSNVVLL